MSTVRPPLRSIQNQQPTWGRGGELGDGNRRQTLTKPARQSMMRSSLAPSQIENIRRQSMVRSSLAPDQIENMRRQSSIGANMFQNGRVAPTGQQARSKDPRPIEDKKYIDYPTYLKFMNTI